ncbi:MAG: hypothetical protein JHD05_05055 [Thermoleophilia bacterium]|nr:hypothetical protein [Thermoleophilia bacterium]
MRRAFRAMFATAFVTALFVTFMTPMVVVYDGQHCYSAPDHRQPECCTGLDGLGNDPRARRANANADCKRR